MKTVFFVSLIMASVTIEGQPARGVGNGDFESGDRAEVCHAIAGWTTYGAPVVRIAVDHAERDGDAALKVARGKAFCYGLPVDPSKAYVMRFRARAAGAKASVESSETQPDALPKLIATDEFDWTEFELTWPPEARRPGIREMWISLSAEATRPGGAVWFDDVRFEPAQGGPNAIPNPSFDEPVVKVAMPAGWVLEGGAADIALDRDDPHGGGQSLRLTGRGGPCRIVQPIDLEPFTKQGVKRVRISGWGRSRSLGEDRVRLEIYGSDPPMRPFLSVSGDSDWTRGEVILDVARQRGRNLAMWINAPRAFNGDAWFDDVTIEPVDDDVVVNLLANPRFKQTLTSPALPDYWGLWGDAVWCVDPWSINLFGIVDEAGPVPGARVLRVHYPPPGGFTPVPPAKGLNVFVLTGGDLNLPPSDYTFSVYAKAARPNTAVHVRHPAADAPLATAKVGPDWVRIQATGRDPRFLAAIHLPEPNSLVWLSAPQLEEGITATPFRGAPDIISIPINESAKPPLAGADRVRDRDPAPLVMVVPPLQMYAEFDAYGEEPFARGRIEWTGALPATIHWRLLDAATGERFPVTTERVALTAPGRQSFSIPLSDLPPGEIGIQAVVTVDGQKCGRAIDSFRKVTQSPHSARINRFTRSLEVDNKPFLPLFLPVEPQKLGDWHLDRLVMSGFNCLVGAPGRLNQERIIQGGLQPGQLAEIRLQLDRLHARGVKLLWPLAWTFDDWDRNRAIYGGDATRLAATFQQVVSAFRDHPAIIGWYLIDEPSKQSWEEAFGFSESDLHMLWAAVKAADDSRPAYVNWNHGWAIEPYGGIHATDIVGHDDYSISGEPFDWGALVPAVRMVNDARAGRRPAFAWISGSYDELALRPNAAAVRVHAWLHLVYGTRGLGYWSKPSLDPAVWAEVQQINREAAGLHANALGLPDAVLAARGKAGAAVHYALWTVGDRAYLLCVNTANSATRIELDVQRACKRTIASSRNLFDPLPVNFVGGILEDAIPPLGRCVYRFVLEPAP